MFRFVAIPDITDPSKMEKLTGPVEFIEVTPLSTIGYSNSSFQKITVVTREGCTKKFMLKQTHFPSDWISLRSNDRIGRESALLEEPYLQNIWNYLYCPYVAFAKEKDTAAMLMEDLSDFLFPDIREPVNIAHENIILNAIASLHAAFWGNEFVKQCPWLTRPADYFNILRPGYHRQDEWCAPPTQLNENMKEGWQIAFEMLPQSISDFLRQPVEKIFLPWKYLPATLVHGDLKIANMAILPSGQLALFDWPLAGCAPCGIELGWFISVNATRLARSREHVLAYYRSCLETHLGFVLDAQLWKKMYALAIVSGAVMMLWSKALHLKSDTQKAKEEWDWWKMNLKNVLS